MIRQRHGKMKTPFALAVLFAFCVLALPAPAESDSLSLGKTWKIFHVMSYHSPWKWTDDQLNGFKAAMTGMPIEYKVFQMDSKHHPSQEARESAGRQACQLIDTWQPDLVYASDDNAMVHVVTHYINSALPFVFSGVNHHPQAYGFPGSQNITGIMEQEHFVQTVGLLKQIVPDVRQIAVIFDQGTTWKGVKDRMEKELSRLPDIQVTSWDVIHTFAQYKARIRALQDQVDAIALLGVFTFKDTSGKSVPYEEVLRWTAENSRLPDFSFWKDRIAYGTLCAVTVSGFEQGFAAGQMARRILVEGASPRSLGMHPSRKGAPVISLARARKLGINIKANLLLTADVATAFQWDN